MNATFERVYRNLGLATVWTLFAVLMLFSSALVSALAGLSSVVPGLYGAAAVMLTLLVPLFAVFLVTTLIAAVIRCFARTTAGSS